jgi:hypothetical protein
MRRIRKLAAEKELNAISSHRVNSDYQTTFSTAAAKS